MEIPGKVAVYCPLIDAKGSAAKLIAIMDGHYQLETTVKGRVHTMLLPVAHTALIFTEPEPEPDPALEIER